MNEQNKIGDFDELEWYKSFVSVRHFKNVAEQIAIFQIFQPSNRDRKETAIEIYAFQPKKSKITFQIFSMYNNNGINPLSKGMATDAFQLFGRSF